MPGTVSVQQPYIRGSSGAGHMVCRIVHSIQYFFWSGSNVKELIEFLGPYFRIADHTVYIYSRNTYLPVPEQSFILRIAEDIFVVLSQTQFKKYCKEV